MILGGHDRGGMRPVLEQLPRLPAQFLELGVVITAQPAPQNQAVAGSDHGGRVELEAAEMANQLEDSIGIRGWPPPAESLAADRQPASDQR